MEHFKRLLLLLPLLCVFMSLSAVDSLQPRFVKGPAQSDQRTEFIHYQETFENGVNGWTHYDGSVPPNNWHIYNAGAPQGNVWWMGDPALANGANIGGYHNSQYLVLDTPAILIPPANANLTFKLKYNLEPVTGATAPYTGWDACNIRISTDNGSSWIVINGTPAYNITSANSFGHEHGEGVGIPGWGGNSNGWVDAVFNLSAYANQNVKIRFAFASDDAYCTDEDPDLFGMMVDDIALGTYTNNGVNDGQITWTSLVPVGGDIWHIAAVADAPSPSHAMTCQNTQGSYNPNMLDYLISPPIQLPDNGSTRADFMLKGSFHDLDSPPNIDYFAWEISVNNGASWNSITQQPFYYGWVAPLNWGLMSVSNPYSFYISDYAGMTALFRISFHSDGDTPDGIGLMIDDFTFWHTPYLAPPTGLTAQVDEQDVILNWSVPNPDEINQVKIYRNGTLIAFVPATTETYTDVQIPGGMHSYYVTAVDDSNESQPSNVAQAFVIPDFCFEMQNDDNSAEAGYNVGSAHIMAARFHTQYQEYLNYVKVYVYTVGTAPMIIRVYNSDGTGGLPGIQLIQFTYPATSLVQGWNYIPIPTGSQILMEGGAFYIAIMEYTNSSAIGLDTDSNGFSYKKITTYWEPLTEGEVMIRAIMQYYGAEEDNTLTPVPTITLYPNPFRDKITISIDRKLRPGTGFRIYNAKGQLVRKLTMPQSNASNQTLQWDGTDMKGDRLPAGVYLCKTESGKFIQSKKILLLR